MKRISESCKNSDVLLHKIRNETLPEYEIRKWGGEFENPIKNCQVVKRIEETRKRYVRILRRNGAISLDYLISADSLPTR